MTRYRRRRLIALVGLVGVLALTAALAAGALRSTDTKGSRVLHDTLDSRLMHRGLAQVAVIAPGTVTGQRPLLVYLHGKGGNEESSVNAGLFAALQRLGPRAPDVVFADGGDDSYWHDRAEGAWGRYVMREVIPQAIRRLHADPSRVAIGGLLSC